MYIIMLFLILIIILDYHIPVFPLPSLSPLITHPFPFLLRIIPISVPFLSIFQSNSILLTVSNSYLLSKFSHQFFFGFANYFPSELLNLILHCETPYFVHLTQWKKYAVHFFPSHYSGDILNFHVFSCLSPFSVSLPLLSHISLFTFFILTIYFLNLLPIYSFPSFLLFFLSHVFIPFSYSPQSFP